MWFGFTKKKNNVEKMPSTWTEMILTRLPGEVFPTSFLLCNILLKRYHLRKLEHDRKREQRLQEKGSGDREGWTLDPGSRRLNRKPENYGHRPNIFFYKWGNAGTKWNDQSGVPPLVASNTTTGLEPRDFHNPVRTTTVLHTGTMLAI